MILPMNTVAKESNLNINNYIYDILNLKLKFKFIFLI